MQETQVRSLGQEDPLEKGMAIHSSILAWRIAWRGEPDGLQSMELKSAGHNWATNSSTNYSALLIKNVKTEWLPYSVLCNRGFGLFQR